MKLPKDLRAPNTFTTGWIQQTAIWVDNDWEVWVRSGATPQASSGPHRAYVSINTRRQEAVIALPWEWRFTPEQPQGTFPQVNYRVISILSMVDQPDPVQAIADTAEFLWKEA